ncbi:MAG: DUF86 domain-containing protein [Gammaproteobacteria bacterium]|jgi:uncharacterized protein YutE (UPF0331/DUF86 family)
MVRPELVRRKLQLITQDLGRLLRFKDIALEGLTNDDIKLAAVERLLERIVMRAIDVNEHLITELATGQEENITRLAYRDTFLRLADLGAYDKSFAESICQSAGLRNILVHDYNDVDHRILHASIRTCLQDYHRYVEHLSAFVARFDEAR